MTPRRLARPALAMTTAALLAVASVAGCSSDSSSPSGDTATSEGDAYQIVPDAVVTVGLAQIEALADDVVAAMPSERSTTGVQQIYDDWSGFEGTIKQNSVDSYLDLEDALSTLKNGVEQDDRAKAERGAADLHAAASAYLLSHPGTAATTAPTGGGAP
jgi:hypothetical protein